MILAERAARLQSEARAAHAEADLTHSRATASSAEALIARLKLEIEKLRRTLYGARSERKERLLDQLEMQLADAEANATEDELEAPSRLQTSLRSGSLARARTRTPTGCRMTSVLSALERIEENDRAHGLSVGPKLFIGWSQSAGECAARSPASAPLTAASLNVSKI